MAAKQKKRRKPKKRIFYPLYWSIVILCAAVIVLLLRGLWKIMEDYEASMPKYVAQEVEKIFTERDFETLYRHDDLTLCKDEGMEAYISYMERLTAGYDITCQEKFSADSNEKVYQVKYGNHKLAVFTLCKSGEVSKYGNKLWMLKEIRSSVIQPQSYRITVPEDSVVYADGQPLGEDEIVERGIEVSDGYLPDGYEHTLWQTYSVTRCLSYPQFEVKDSRGRMQRIIPGESDSLSVIVNYDDEMRGEAEEDVAAAAKAFAMFTSGDRTVRQVMEYVGKDSKAAKYIAGFDDSWVIPHKAVEFHNLRTEHYVQYDSNTFSCDVYFDYHIVYRSGTEVYPTGYTFFFTEQDGKWVIFDFTTAD